MSLLEHLQPEIGEHPRRALGHSPVVIRIAPAAQHEQDRPRELTQPRDIQARCPERLQELRSPAGRVAIHGGGPGGGRGPRPPGSADWQRTPPSSDPPATSRFDRTRARPPAPQDPSRRGPSTPARSTPGSAAAPDALPRTQRSTRPHPNSPPDGNDRTRRSRRYAAAHRSRSEACSPVAARARVDLELLRDRVHTVAETLEQRAVCELGRHHATGKQDRRNPHGRGAYPAELAER